MKICIVGMGYVGLPLACALTKKFQVVGFDISDKKVQELKKGVDSTGEVEDLRALSKIEFVNDINFAADASVYVLTVPTPIDDQLKPDLELLKLAAIEVGSILCEKDLVILESTVYPGVTRDIVGRMCAESSGLAPSDFGLGYSPERINPGDKLHRLINMPKIVAASDGEYLQQMKKIYSCVTEAEIVTSDSIEAAEFAKVIENTQRDINIALINKVHRLAVKDGISTDEVLRLAGTKWNFHQYVPGLVGGHCIGVDPYYLAKYCEDLNENADLLLSGRDVNESMVDFWKDWILTQLEPKGHILFLGCSFKPDVPDIRNSKVLEIVDGIRSEGIKVTLSDEMVREVANSEVRPLESLELEQKFDGIVVGVAHSRYKNSDFIATCRAAVRENSPLLSLVCLGENNRYFLKL